MSRKRVADTLFKVGITLIPVALTLGLIGFLITPPGEGEVHWLHMMGDDRYDKYFDDTKLSGFDYDQWHLDWVIGNGIQVLAAVLLFIGGVLALTMYRTDEMKAVPTISEVETTSWSLPPPEPRRRWLRRLRIRVSRRAAITATASVVVAIVFLVAVLPVLQAYAAGPKHSAVVSVTIEDNQMLIWEGEYWVYINDKERASGILTRDSIVGSGEATVNITVTWHGNATYSFSVSCWYDGRIRTSDIQVADRQTTTVYFDVGFH